MTCIVAIVGNGKIFMGADSYGSDGQSGEEALNPKCFVNGDFIIGCTTSFRMIDILRYKFSMETTQENSNKDADAFIRTKFVDKVRDCFENNGFTRTVDSVEYGGSFLVGYKQKIYEIQDDFSVINKHDYGAAVGCGEESARGSLFTTRHMLLDVKTKALAALEAAESVSCGVRGPFIIINN